MVVLIIRLLAYRLTFGGLDMQWEEVGGLEWDFLSAIFIFRQF